MQATGILVRPYHLVRIQLRCTKADLTILQAESRSSFRSHVICEMYMVKVDGMSSRKITMMDSCTDRHTMATLTGYWSQFQ
jgi:hypothetical protein